MDSEGFTDYGGIIFNHKETEISDFDRAINSFDSDKLIELFKAGHDINGCDYEGNNSLMLAIMYEDYELEEFCYENNINVNATNNQGETALMIIGKTMNEIRQNQTYYDERNYDMLESIRILGIRGADATIVSKSGKKTIDYFKETKPHKPFGNWYLKTARKRVIALADQQDVDKFQWYASFNSALNKHIQELSIKQNIGRQSLIASLLEAREKE